MTKTEVVKGVKTVINHVLPTTVGAGAVTIEETTTITSTVVTPVATITSTNSEEEDTPSQ